MCQERNVSSFFWGQMSLFLPEKYDFNTYKGFLENYCWRKKKNGLQNSLDLLEKQKGLIWLIPFRNRDSNPGRLGESQVS